MLLVIFALCVCVWVWVSECIDGGSFRYRWSSRFVRCSSSPAGRRIAQQDICCSAYGDRWKGVCNCSLAIIFVLSLHCLCYASISHFRLRQVAVKMVNKSQLKDDVDRAHVTRNVQMLQCNVCLTHDYPITSPTLSIYQACTFSTSFPCPYKTSFSCQYLSFSNTQRSSFSSPTSKHQ